MELNAHSATTTSLAATFAQMPIPVSSARAATTSMDPPSVSPVKWQGARSATKPTPPTASLAMESTSWNRPVSASTAARRSPTACSAATPRLAYSAMPASTTTAQAAVSVQAQ